MRVAIRTDASTAIGTGHFKRCLALAAVLWERGTEVRFVWRDHGLDCGGELAAQGFDQVCLARPSANWEPAADAPGHARWAGIDGEVDAAETAKALADWKPDWLVIDHYGFDQIWHVAAREKLGCRIAAIDDLGDRALAADIVVDHNLAKDHAAKHRVSKGLIGKLLGGPRFALLAPAYRDLTPVAIGDEVASIGIFMGGVDGGNHSEKALAACRAAGFAGPIEIATTNANPHLASLGRAVAADGAASLLLDQPELGRFFTRHDLQIGAGGGASWERCRAGVPAIVLATAANQQVVVDGLIRHQAAMGLGLGEETMLPAILHRLLRDPGLRQTIGENTVRLVDGRGCERVALAMGTECVTVRPATMTDANMAHRWRNDPATRAVSGDPSKIELNSHLEWFASSLTNPDRYILIGQIGGQAIGVVRFDRIATSEWVVSIYVDPALTGLGLGVPMLLAAEQALADRHVGALHIEATTLPENTASQAMFRKCGYTGDVVFRKLIGDQEVQAP